MRRRFDPALKGRAQFNRRYAAKNEGCEMKQGLLKHAVLLLLLLLWLAPIISAQPVPRVAEIDRVRLAEAFRIGDALGNRVWSGWDKAPFCVLLVTPDNEFLIRHPKPSADFVLISYDTLLKSNVY